MTIGKRLLLSLVLIPVVALAAGHQDSHMRDRIMAHDPNWTPFGPLKALASADASNGASARRFLVVTMPGNPSRLVLRQVGTSNAKKRTS
jgi:hypothetical protein